MTGGGCTVADYAWGAATAGVASVSAKRMGCDRSFSEDTLVTTEEGLVPISEIEEGDYVLAYNEETGEVGYYPVTATWVHEDPVLTYLVIEGEFITTTPTHLFYTTTGWVEAGELGEDAYVVRAGGAPGQVWESLTFTLPCQMYDLTVAEAHTFFVGEQQWLVHNCNLGDSEARALRDLIEESTQGGRIPLSVDEAETVLDWAQEMDYPGWRAGINDVTGAHGPGPHLNIPQSVNGGHVPISPGVAPRVNPNLNPRRR